MFITDEYEIEGSNESGYIPEDYSKLSHVGMIIQSTTLDTEAKVKAIYGSNTSWIQHSGYVLRGATSGVIANHTGNDGGADSATVSSVASHSHTQYEHGHTQWGISNASGGTAPRLSLQNDGNVVIYYTNGVAATGLGNTSGRGNEGSITIGGGQNRGVSNETAINLPNGSNYTVNTLPKYKNVYIWERTA